MEPGVSGQKPQARGPALWRSFGEGREIALIGPAVTVALKAQAFSPGFYLIVAGSLSRTRSPEGAESFLTAGEGQRTRCARATPVLMTAFNSLW